MITIEYYATTKKDKIIQFTETWIEMEASVLNKISQRKEEKY